MEVPAGPTNNRAVKRNFLGSLSLAITFVSAFSKDCHADSNHLTVRLLVYVDLAAATRADMEAHATRILRTAGIATSFVECYRGGAPTGTDGCNGPLGPDHLALRVLHPKFAVKGEQLGYAAMTPEGGAYVTVFINPAQDKARDRRLSDGIFLGHVVAHEIGHLLLGPSSHSSAGIMRAVWRPGDEELMLKGALLFDKSQSKTMQASLLSRLGR
jgi:hypothetical protein